LAIPLSSNDDGARAVLHLSLLPTLLAGGLLLIVFLLAGETLVIWLNVPGLAPYLWFLPVGAILAGIYQALNSWAVRVRDFKAIAYTRAQQGVGMVLAQVALGWLGTGNLGLLVGDVLGRAAGITRLLRSARSIWALPCLSSLGQAALRYRKFPLMSMGSTLLNRLGLQLPYLLLAGFYGPQVAGWYMLVQRVMGLPSSLVGQAVAQVYLGEASRLRRENPTALKALYINTAQKLFLIGALPILVGGMVGSLLFGFIFGKDWAMAGKYLFLLTPMFAVQFVVVPLSQTLVVLERQELQLVWDVLRLLLVFAALQGSSVLGWKSLWAVGALGLTMLASYVALAWMSLSVLRAERKAF